MRWRIKEFVFCERQQTLTSDQQVQQLEPMVVELLAFFCRNADQIISRSQLIQEVWLGRLITDNAVNKVVTKLRKILNDDAKKPQFIATFPKKGYKFIAEVFVIEDKINMLHPSPDKMNSPSRAYKQKFKLLWSTLFLIVVIAVIILIGKSVNEENYKKELIVKVKPLTRAAGRETAPQVSPDGKHLAFIEVRDNEIRLWIKSLVDEKSIEIVHEDEEQAWIGPASWNSDGSLFAYLITTTDSCKYFLRSFDNLIVGEAKLIHNCPTGSAGKIAFTHDDNRLIYTEAEDRHSPYTLFEINLLTGKKKRLNQPAQFLGGNSQFDIHPEKNILLISSPDKQQWEGFYSLDLETDELNLLFKQDAYICCGIWNHTGDRVVLMGEHPAYQLVSYDFDGENSRIIYSGSQQVRSPQRHINGKDYLFAAFNVNQNVLFYDFQTNASKSIANASVEDRFATFAHHNNKIAYIGLSSGSEEIWIANTEQKKPTKITNFNDSRHYIDLLWSYSGEHLIALTLNEIHLIDSETGLFTVLKIPQVEIRGVSWKSNQIISYSTKYEGGWRINYYDIKTHQSILEKESWDFIRYTKNAEDTLWIDSNNKLFSGSDTEEVLDKELLSVNFVVGRTFNIRKLGNKWAWQQRVNGKYHLMIKENLDIPGVQQLVSDSFHFDFSNAGLLYNTVEALNADIYQTVSD